MYGGHGSAAPDTLSLAQLVQASAHKVGYWILSPALDRYLNH
jgi:hypothetical protein